MLWWNNRKFYSTTNVTKLVGGVGEINFGKQYRQGNRVYDADYIAMALTAQPLGNAGGYSYLYKISAKIPIIS